MITFAIPTYNRAEKLRVCVESIAVQRPERIIIADDASTDNTPQVCAELVKKYPFITYLRFDERLNFTGNYKRACLASESEYTWTFGDDDLLMDLAVSFMEGTIKNTRFDFYHVAETIRSASAEAMCGTVWDICNAIGWIEFTGFISCNITKTSTLHDAVNSPEWELYGKSAFPQSLGILDAAAHKSAMICEIGCVQSSDMEDPDTIKRWQEDNVSWKYLFVGDGLRHLVAAGKIPPQATENFFRYIQGSLFDRLMREFNGRAVLAPHDLEEAHWDCLEVMSDMVAGERGDKIRAWVKGTRAKVAEEIGHWKESQAAYARLTEVVNSIEFPVYPLNYLP